jgi:hypothetical protein
VGVEHYPDHSTPLSCSSSFPWSRHTAILIIHHFASPAHPSSRSFRSPTVPPSHYSITLPSRDLVIPLVSIVHLSRSSIIPIVCHPKTLYILSRSCFPTCIKSFFPEITTTCMVLILLLIKRFSRQTAVNVNTNYHLNP